MPILEINLLNIHVRCPCQMHMLTIHVKRLCRSPIRCLWDKLGQGSLCRSYLPPHWEVEAAGAAVSRLHHRVLWERGGGRMIKRKKEETNGRESGVEKKWWRKEWGGKKKKQIEKKGLLGPGLYCCSGFQPLHLLQSDLGGVVWNKEYLVDLVSKTADSR